VTGSCNEQPAVDQGAGILKGAGQMAGEGMTQDERRAAAIKLFEGWRSKAMDDMADDSSPDMGAWMTDLSMDNVFSKLWLREGLDLRSRSLLTLGILIGVGAYEELTVHFPIALKNGCTLEELNEVIYHATAYAGFPAANNARRAAVRSLRMEGVID
jgi:4-carboxymuconolactone decarboxylase